MELRVRLFDRHSDRCRTTKRFEMEHPRVQVVRILSRPAGTAAAPGDEKRQTTQGRDGEQTGHEPHLA